MTEEKGSFEARLQSVQAIISQIEEGKLSLEESVKQFENGMKTLSQLDEEMKDMSRRLTVLKDGKEQELQGGAGQAADLLSEGEPPREDLVIYIHSHKTADLLEAMRYSLEAGGKRLRPVMLLAACDMAGGDTGTALPFACAMEMIHTYSLIHDDLPAMDNDDFRRGKPTNHKVFGEGMAVLAGDGLLNAAAELMAGAALRMADSRGIRAMEIIMRHAGVTGMIAGQAADLLSEGEPPREDLVIYILPGRLQICSARANLPGRIW